MRPSPADRAKRDDPRGSGSGGQSRKEGNWQHGETTSPKREYIADLRVQELRDDSHRILARLAASGRALATTKIHLQEATEAIEMAEANLMMSDAYAGGKNAEIRKAWLMQQRESDPALSEALEAKRRLEMDLARDDAEVDAASHEWQLRIAELRLISAQLLFLAGGAL